MASLTPGKDRVAVVNMDSEHYGKTGKVVKVKQSFHAFPVVVEFDTPTPDDIPIRGEFKFHHVEKIESSEVSAEEKGDVAE